MSKKKLTVEQAEKYLDVLVEDERSKNLAEKIYTFGIAAGMDLAMHKDRPSIQEFKNEWHDTFMRCVGNALSFSILDDLNKSIVGISIEGSE